MGSDLPQAPRSRLARVIAGYVAFAERRTGALLLALGLLAIAALTVATRLELHTDMAELLPDEHPSVFALRRISGRQKASTSLVLLLESPDGAANRRFAEALRPELERLVGSVFTEVQWRENPDKPAFAERWKWLYAGLPELARIEELVERAIARRGSALYVDLDDSTPEDELKKLRADLDKRVPRLENKPYFEGQDGDSFFLGIILWKRGSGVASFDDHDTLARTREVVARFDPERFHSQLRVRWTGPVAMSIAEHKAIQDDLTLATALCSSLVLLSIYLYFRRIGVLWVVGAPAFLGVLLALALGRFTIHYLNANTAFLIPIILGNGINWPIIVLGRFGEERRAGREVGEALVTALDRTMLATGTAMAAASVAYGSLLLTSFRGFNQFGLVGGAGMLLVWLATFALVPPMVIFGERLRPGALTPRRNLVRGAFAAFGRLTVRRPMVLVALTLASIAVCAPRLARYLGDPMEWNFRKLRSRETQAQRDWNRMYHVGMANVYAGHIATDGVLLVDHADQAEPVAAALREQDRGRGDQRILKEVRTLRSVLPQSQEAKLAILERLRRHLDLHRDQLDERARAELLPLRPPEYLRPVTVEDLPRSVREAFTEVDGQRGRMVGIDADGSRYDDWNGHDLIRLSRAMSVEALGKRWVAASTATVFGGMLETIVRDMPRVTAAALGGVSLLLVVTLGARGALLVALAMAVGLAWLGGLLATLDIKLNFVNFVGIPITLGVGTDYAANIWARVRKDGAERLVDVVADTGSAVALCSLTTIIGYSSLLLASNRALQSFGSLAVLGELTCLVAALMILPAIVALLRQN